MANRDQIRRSSRPAWQAWTCVLLIGVVLYNPFVGLFHAGDALSYHKLARHRATVGSSELQHFSPVPDTTDQPDAALNTNGAEPAKGVERAYRGIFQHQVAALQVEMPAGVWFRPPPTL